MKSNGFVLLLAFVYFEQSNGCGRRSEECFGSSQGYPFQFGITDLLCVARGKRSPIRSTIQLDHRYIKYRDIYYEFMPGRTEINTSPFRSHVCRTTIEPYVAGYGVLSSECVTGCANYYGRVTKYHLLSNNCHIFANWLAHILCKESSCPSYCQRYM